MTFKHTYVDSPDKKLHLFLFVLLYSADYYRIPTQTYRGPRLRREPITQVKKL